jgi:hypothetical protein
VSLSFKKRDKAYLTSVAYLGEEQRRIPVASNDDILGQERILGRGAGEVGGVPWAVQGKQEQEVKERELEAAAKLRSR